MRLRIVLGCFSLALGSIVVGGSVASANTSATLLNAPFQSRALTDGEVSQNTYPSPQNAIPGTVTTSGNMMTWLVAAPKGVQPDSSSGTSGNVTIILNGSGLTLQSWEMTAGPVIPGECTYGAFWAPTNSLYEVAPETCNKTDSLAYYWACVI